MNFGLKTKNFFILSIIYGALIFLVSMAYLNEAIMQTSLVLMMSGGIGIYLLENYQNTPKSPPHLKSKKITKK